jgi:hypothetical protein
MTTLILDLNDSELAHTRIDCSAHLAFVDFLSGTTDLDDAFDVAERQGLLIPSYFAEGLRACAHCTLVAAPVWRAAA